MANEGVELTAAKTMKKPRPPTPPISRAVPAGKKKSRPPPSRSSSSAKTGKASSGTKKKGSGSGSKQTAKKRAKQRAMTPEERAAKKRQSIIGSISTAVILIGCGVAIWYFALGAPTTVGEFKDGVGNAINNTKTKIDAIGDVLDNLDGLDWGGFFRDDPWQGNTTVTMWNEKYIKRDNGGLQLTIVNSLSADWQKEFETAVADWSESDSLTLSVEVLPVDDAWDNEKKCARQTGKMVVCNGNFGDEGWVGINLNEVQQNGRIISSVAQMNEYYLRNANFYHRRFTMCHEIGHGFGLPHTDENPYNKNQGNCMDYTDDPEENLLPGEVNMNALREVYLSQEPERRLLRRVEQPDGTAIETIGWLINEDKAEAWGL